MGNPSFPYSIAEQVRFIAYRFILINFGKIEKLVRFPLPEIGHKNLRGEKENSKNKKSKNKQDITKIKIKHRLFFQFEFDHFFNN